MKAYKGFDKDLKCRGFQYEVGKTYEENSARLCEKGFHACESPLDVFAYYPPATSRYCEVELEDVDEKRDTDSKRVGKKITIGAEIGIPGLAKAHVEWVKEHLIDDKKHKISSPGDMAASTSTGYMAASTSTGDMAASTSTGDMAASTSTGYMAASVVSGKDSVAIACGRNSKAKASIGSAIVVVERDDFGKLLGIKAAIVDGKRLKPDVFYTLKNGRIVKAEE